MKIGFIGLGNVGAKLAGSVLRNGHELTVHDLDKNAAENLLGAGAAWADTPKQLAEGSEVIITCLPNPAASAAVLESSDGVIAGFSAGKIWAEMSTTDAAEVQRLGAKVEAAGGSAIELSLIHI